MAEMVHKGPKKNWIQMEIGTDHLGLVSFYQLLMGYQTRFNIKSGLFSNHCVKSNHESNLIKLKFVKPNLLV